MDYGVTPLSVVVFTLRIPPLGFDGILIIRRIPQCFWETVVIWGILSFYPNTLTAYTAGMKMLNPSHTGFSIYPQMNSVILVLHADARGNFKMD